MTEKDDVVVMDAKEDGRQYVIAYSLKEQKRANDLSEKWLKTVNYIFLTALISALLLYIKLDTINIVSKMLSCY